MNSRKEEATRDGFGRGLLELGAKDPRVVVLCADLAESTRVLSFKERYPDRYIELGVAEQNLATVASGLANYGKIPFITSYAAFSPGRNNEQIRTTISLNNLRVIIVGAHAGVSVGQDGATHQALEDMAIMRAQPKMTVISPCDSEEARKATVAAIDVPGPVYIRLAREKTPVLTEPGALFEVGKAQTMWESEHKPEVAVFATGPLLAQALEAAKSIEKTVPTIVVNVATVKPLDPTLIEIAKQVGAVVTVEEHQVMGGFGSAVAELLATTQPVPMEFIGMHDTYGQSGEPKELIRHYGMSAAHIAAAVKKVRARKV